MVGKQQTIQFKASEFHAFSINFNKRRNLVRDQEVGGSNPLAPISIACSDSTNRLFAFLRESRVTLANEFHGVNLRRDRRRFAFDTDLDK